MSNQDIAFRPIAEADREFLCRLYASTREEEMVSVPWSDEQKREFLRFQFDAQHHYYRQQFSDARFDLILLGGEPAGRLYVDRRADEVRLIDIALLPRHRGRGIGGRIMRQLLDQAAADDLPVQIHVEKNNPALKLYHRLGFHEVDDQGVYWLMRWEPGGPEPAL